MEDDANTNTGIENADVFARSRLSEKRYGHTLRVADTAGDLARVHGLDEDRARLIWDSVALNSTPSIGLYKEPEVALCTAGIGVEFGFQYDQIPPNEMKSILAAFPRLEMKRRFTDAVCRVVETKPATTYDNFAGDFGERFVAGYTRPSTVDYLMSAPFDE